MPRSRLTALAVLPLLAASMAACASTGGPSRYQSELETYAAECRERGGLLQPIPGANTGQVRADNACIIRGGASLID